MNCLFCNTPLKKGITVGDGPMYECKYSDGGCMSDIRCEKDGEIVLYNFYIPYKNHKYYIDGSKSRNKTNISLSDTFHVVSLLKLKFQPITLKNYNNELIPLVKRAAKLLVYI